MKKEYKKPAMRVIALHHCGIICTSDPKTLQGTDDEWMELG